MSKKITLIIITAFLLISVETLTAQQEKGNPVPRQKQRQERRLKAETQALNETEQSEIKAPEGPAAPNKPKGQKRFGIMEQPNQPFRRRFSRWLDALTKAYQENDRDKMGQLIRKMHRFREELSQRREAIHHRWRESQGRRTPKAGPSRFNGRHGKWDQDFPPIGMTRPDRDRPRENMDRSWWSRPRRGIAPPPRHPRHSEDLDTERQGPPRYFHDRDFGKWGKGPSKWDDYDYQENKPLKGPWWQDEKGSEWDW